MSDFVKGINKIGEAMSAVISAEMTAKAVEDRADKKN